MKKIIGIIGLSWFGLNLVDSFSKLNVEFIVIDNNKDLVKKVSEVILNVFVCDFIDEEVFKVSGIFNVDYVIVVFG